MEEAPLLLYDEDTYMSDSGMDDDDEELPQHAAIDCTSCVEAGGAGLRRKVGRVAKKVANKVQKVQSKAQQGVLPKLHSKLQQGVQHIHNKVQQTAHRVGNKVQQGVQKATQKAVQAAGKIATQKALPVLKKGWKEVQKAASALAAGRGEKKIFDWKGWRDRVNMFRQGKCTEG